MTKKIQWGVLGAATIAVEQVIPAMLQSEYCAVRAIASRNIEKGREVAKSFKIPHVYGSYQDLLGDNEIQAVYIPLPNHLHVEWAINALRAGKHVLVEKPVAMNSKEAQELLVEANKHPELKVMEAYMYKFHPQWVKAKQMIQDGEIGHLETIQASFSFFDADPNSIVNNKVFGGGSLMDIGCYPVSISRFLFDAEPKRIVSNLEYHLEFGVDVHASAILEFDEGRCVFFSSIQLFEDQQVKLFGTTGSIAFDMPFNPQPGKQVKIWLVKENTKNEMVFEPCNQYGLQADIFSKAILEGMELPVSLEDAVKNMAVIDAIKESDLLGRSIAL